MLILQLCPRKNTKQFLEKKIPGISVLVARGKVSDKSNLKILNPKEILQRFLIAFAQVKTGKRSKELLNEIRKIIYDLY